MWLPSASVAKYSRPTSMAVAGRSGTAGCGTSTTQEKDTYHWLALRRMVTALMLPAMGRLHLTLSSPMPRRLRRSSIILQPVWWKVNES